MKPFTRSVIELFDGKQRYLIPLYQRKYAWKVDPQLTQFWGDVTRTTQALIDGGEQSGPHFMGALVIAKVKTYGRQVTAYEVIDGQQRLTTFQLMLAALRDVAREINSPYAEEAEKYIFNDGVMENQEVEKYALWPSLADRRSFINAVDPEVDASEIVNTNLDEDGYVRLAMLAHRYFKKEITKFIEVDNEASDDNEDEKQFRMEKLFETLKTGLATVSIELEGDDDPQTIFETLNSRGVELSQSDLMRNFIFQRATGLGLENGSLKVDAIYEKHWLPLDSSFWQDVESRAKRPRSRVDWMLNDHLTMKQARLLSADDLFRNYQKWIINEKPYESLQNELLDIDRTRHVSAQLFERDVKITIGEFGHFLAAFDVTTAIPMALYLSTEAELDDQELKDALAWIKSYILRRDVCGLTTKNYNRVFAGLIDKLRSSDDSVDTALPNLLMQGEEDTNRFPDDAEFNSGWMTRKQYTSGRKARLRYIFEALENRLRTRFTEDTPLPFLTIEHIMPRKWETHWPLLIEEGLSESEEELERLNKTTERHHTVNLMGNLTLLTSELNSKSSHKSFDDRMPEIKAHSSLALNRALDHYTEWNEETIKERGEELFSHAKDIWTRPLIEKEDA